MVELDSNILILIKLLKCIFSINILYIFYALHAGETSCFVLPVFLGFFIYFFIYFILFYFYFLLFFFYFCKDTAQIFGQTVVDYLPSLPVAKDKEMFISNAMSKESAVKTDSHHIHHDDGKKKRHIFRVGRVEEIVNW